MKEIFFANIDKLKRDFGEVTISDRNNSHYLNMKIEYGKNINKKLRIDAQTELCSFLSVGFNDAYEIVTGLVPIDISIIFTWYSKEDNAYPVTLPKYARTLWAPENIELREYFLWDYQKNIFYNRKRHLIDIVAELLYFKKKHIAPTRVYAGLFFRLSRFIIWYPISILIESLKNASVFLYHATSGKKIKIKETEYFFNYLFGKAAKPQYEIVQESESFVNFFGININLLPLITYSTIHFAIFTYMYISNIKPPYIKTVMQNTFLMITYIVISLSFMQFVISKIIQKLINFWLRLAAIINTKKVPRFVK